MNIIDSMTEKISYEDRREISNLVVTRHGVFYKFWDLVTPFWNDEIPTACVGINNKNENLSFYINKKFWNELSTIQKQFIICHECYHLINHHGIRANGKFDIAKNQALDVPINEGLVKYFGFDRKALNMEEYCWVDTVFPDGSAEHGRSFEYYYDLLKQQNRVPQKLKFINDHSGIGQVTDEISDQFIDKFIESLDDAEAQNLKHILERSNVSEQKDANKDNQPNSKYSGTGTSRTIHKINNFFTPKKKKWEQIIKKFAKKYVEKDFETLHWVSKSRRMSLFHQDFMMPNEIENNDRVNEKNKSSVFVFLDVSGSCLSYKDRFFKAFESIPKNITVRLFSFDDVAYELNKQERQVIGGGGTSIRCIDEKINEIVSKENILYPKNVFVLTDCYFPKIKVKNPKNWIFLSTSGVKDTLPDGSKFYNLSDYE
jgi:hypothetical protein